MPHEVAGFAGGAKYFFPGVAGPELTHLTHWLGALATIERVIGRVETPTRRVIEAAADRVTTPVIAFTSVSTRDDVGLADARAVRRRPARNRPAGRRGERAGARPLHRAAATAASSRCSTSTTTSCGSAARRATSSAASSRTAASWSSTRRTSPAFRRRTARLIEKYGYAPLETVREMVEGSDELRANLCVAAHLAHVAYGGREGSRRGRRSAIPDHARRESCRRRRAAASISGTSICERSIRAPSGMIRIR